MRTSSLLRSVALLVAASQVALALPMPAEEEALGQPPPPPPPLIFDPSAPRPDPLFDAPDAGQRHRLPVSDSDLHTPPLQLVRTETLPAYTGALVHPPTTPYPPSAEDADEDAGEGSLRMRPCWGRKAARTAAGAVLLLLAASAAVWLAECLLLRCLLGGSRRRALSLKAARAALDEVRRVAALPEWAADGARLDRPRSPMPGARAHGLREEKERWRDGEKAGAVRGLV